MVRIVADHIISPLGFGTEENLQAVFEERSALGIIEDELLWPEPVVGAAFSSDQKEQISSRFSGYNLTLLESMMAGAIEKVLKESELNLKSKETQLILTTTKGNIDLLHEEVNKPIRSLLFNLGDHLAEYFSASQPVLIVSNACISGLSAIITGARMLQNGAIKNVVVCGGDLLTRFTLSGFQSFKAVSPEPCRPYDADRAGISLGEGVGAIALTISDDAGLPAFVSGASANDANHISGPSRTGEGLYQSIRRTMVNTPISPEMISAHGTATAYNDEMECQAFNRVGMQHVPLHSLKGIYGHTLGAAGVIETIIAVRALRQQRLVPSVGYKNHGVSLPLGVTRKSTAATLHSVLKTSSGFGGSNAAALFSL